MSGQQPAPGARPHDDGAERIVLGAMMSNPAVIETITDRLTSRDLYRPAHATIYTHLLAAWAAGEPTEPVALAHRLDAAGELHKVGGAVYLADLLAAVPTAAQAPYYATLVADCAHRRHLAEQAIRLSQAAETTDPTRRAELVAAVAAEATSRTAADGWNDPLPLGWRTDLAAFPVDALPPVLARYVRAVAAELQTPPDLPGTVTLGVLAAAIGGSVRVRIRSGWAEPTNLYVVPVAEPASRKSAVVGECRIPLGTAEQLLREQYGVEVVDSRTTREILDQRAARLVAAAAKTGDPADLAEAQDAVRAAEAVTVLAWPRLTTADATPEALVSLLADQGGRIAAMSAEAGVFDSLGGRYTKTTNIEALLMAHAGDEILVDRRGRPPERVEKPALTLMASIQPYALRGLLAREDFAGRGMLARVLWSLTADLAGTRTWEAPEAPEAVKVAYRTLIVDLAVGTYRRHLELTLAPAAYKLLGEYHDTVERLVRRPDGDYATGLIRQWAGKLVGAVARLAGGLHAATVGADITTHTEIGENTMHTAVSLGEYYRAHADAALATNDDHRTDAARTILDLLLRRDMATFTLRDLLRAGPKPLRKAHLLTPVLDYLHTLGWTRPTPTGGYQLHPDTATHLQRATGATEATPDHDDSISAGQPAPDPRGNASPTGATPGDSPSPPSPPVARAGDTQHDDDPATHHHPPTRATGATPSHDSHVPAGQPAPHPDTPPSPTQATPGDTPSPPSPPVAPAGDRQGNHQHPTPPAQTPPHPTGVAPVARVAPPNSDTCNTCGWPTNTNGHHLNCEGPDTP